MRILMRGTLDPLENMPTSQFIIENHIGGNIGNLIFTNSIARTVMVDEDTTIDYINLRMVKLNRKYADYVNETYDMFLIPLANAFKGNGHDELMLIADFVKKLTIPCCIIGVGIQHTLEEGRFIDFYRYNDEAKAMISAVLEKSPIIGVRGELTGEYFKDLGFIPEKDYTVIGCPSMFTFGDKLPEVKNTILTPDSVVAFNSKIQFEVNPEYKNYTDFFKRTMAEFKNSVYAQQQIDDMRMMYLDSMKTELRAEKNYDIAKAVAFNSITGWINYFKNNVDFSVGARIHGNVAAILGGLPAITIPFNRRVLELSDYHNIQTLPLSKINDELTLYDVFEKADFNAVHRGHKERFEHYLDFLHQLGITTIYDREYEGDVPFDKIVKERHYPEVIKAFDALNEEEKIDRYREAFLTYKGKFHDKQRVIKNKNEQIENKKDEIKALKKERKELQRQLDHPFKLVIKFILKKLGINYSRKKK